MSKKKSKENQLFRSELAKEFLAKQEQLQEIKDWRFIDDEELKGFLEKFFVFIGDFQSVKDKVGRLKIQLGEEEKRATDLWKELQEWREIFEDHFEDMEFLKLRSSKAYDHVVTTLVEIVRYRKVQVEELYAADEAAADLEEYEQDDWGD